MSWSTRAQELPWLRSLNSRWSLWSDDATWASRFSGSGWTFGSRSRRRRYDEAMADLNQIAHRIVRESTEPKAPESKAQTSGRKGGLKGGQARAAKLSPDERSEIARRAAQARWAKQAN
jgi:hypothetical protein